MAIREASTADGQRYTPILASLLAGRMLACEKGPARIVPASEFGIMHVNGLEEVGFKHRGTRNYVYLRKRFDKDQGSDVWVLDVPFTPDAFHRGFFDKL